MSNNKDYDAIDAETERRFPGTSFSISCFDSVRDVNDRVVNYFDQTIIIAYEYHSEYYKKLDIWLQDCDYITVSRQEGENVIRFCDIIDAIRGNELAGNIKPCHHLYLEDIRRVEGDRNRIPMYKICWGS
jgi:hypothetical protein